MCAVYCPGPHEAGLQRDDGTEQAFVVRDAFFFGTLLVNENV